MHDHGETKPVEITSEADRGRKGLTVGRVVHYVSYGTPGGEYQSECRAATVTEVVPRPNPHLRPWASLCILNPTGMFFARNLLYDEGHAPGTWHWPEPV